MGDTAKKATEDTKKNVEQSEVPEANLAAGVVGKSGEIVNEAGETVGKITEGDPGDLVGNVVTATGDIVGKDGGIVGKALPLDSAAGDSNKSVFGTLMGATKGVKGVVDTVDGTVQTVEKTLPLVGNLTKGLGLGGDGGALGGLLGKKSEDRDATEKAEASEQAKKELFDNTDKAADAAPIDLKDEEAIENAKTDVESKSQPPQSEASESKDEATEASTDDNVTVKDGAKGATDAVSGTLGGAKDTVEDTAGSAKDTVEDTVGGVKDTAEDTTESAKDTVEDTTGSTKNTTDDTASGAKDTVDDTVSGAKDTVDDTVSGAKDTADDTVSGAKDTADDTVSGAKDTADDTVSGAKDTAEDTTQNATDSTEKAAETAETAAEDTTKDVPKDTDSGKGLDDTSEQVNTTADGAKDTAEAAVDDTKSTAEGAKDETVETAENAAEETTKDVPKDTDSAKGLDDTAEAAVDDTQSTAEGVKDTAEETAEDTKDVAEDAKSEAPKSGLTDKAKSELDEMETIADVQVEDPFKKFEGAQLDDEGKVIFDNQSIGKLVEGDPIDLANKEIAPDGAILNEDGSEIGRVELKSEIAEDLQKQAEALAALKGAKVNKAGNLVNDKNEAIGRVVEGTVAKLVGRKADAQGRIWNDSGEQIGLAEPIPDKEREEFKEPSPFEDFPDATVQSNGDVTSDGEKVGVLVEGDAKKLKGKKVDEDGEVQDRQGNVLGRAERWEPEEEEAAPEVDNSALAGKKVNKAGNVVDSNGVIFGRVIEGEVSQLVGRACNKKGEVLSESGEKVGLAELVPEHERREQKDLPFENFPEAIVQSNGEVTNEGDIVGRLIEGDAKKLKGSRVDADGEIQDRQGNVIGKAERWEPEEAEPEPEVDNSALAGKRVNKAGNVVDSNGSIFGRLVEGDPKRLAGRMCDKKGNVLSESGDVVGRAELVSEGEREGLKEGPFAELPGCTVAKDGTVVTPSGDVVGRLTSGDGKKLFGRSVDEDGDILDSNGNTLGKAERWEPEEVEKKKGPMAGRRVNKKGDVVNEDGDLIGKLTSGDLSVCSGKEIDDDGDVVDSKGTTIGHVSLIEDIPEPEPEPEEPKESEEEKKAREEAEQDEKLAKNLASQVEQSLDKIRPICKLISDKIDKAERTPKDELDEDALVKEVKPLIEEGGNILSELNGTIRAMDPDGRIQRNAKHKSSTSEASPAEHHLADLLKELSGSVATCVDNAKKKIADMPHAKKELNPLWGLLTEPLGQILAAVGLLLAGVLNLVGRLLSGLGLGGILDGLLGSLGLNRVLDSLGLGSITGALTGKNKK
ncbi:hypothetical protein ACHAQA_008432 [Verticillium albo-atrum]